MPVPTPEPVTTHTGPFRLRDGRDVWLRPLGAADAPALMLLYGRLSAQTIRRRFMQLVPVFDQQTAEALAAVDQVHRVAIAAVPDPSADETIVAVGRFHGDGGERAELALLVQDDYQRFGLGRLLLARLIDEAARRRVRLLDGLVLHGNQSVLRLLRSCGRPLDVSWHGGDVLHIRLQVVPCAAEMRP